MIQALTILALSVLVIILFTRLERQEKKIEALSDAMKIVDDLFSRYEDAMKEFDHRMIDMRKKLEKAEDIMEAHAEMEKEAANSERLFQEGLTNLLNYGVSKE